MRALSFLVVDTYYPAFLDRFHRSHPELADADYDTVLDALLAECFGTSDFYSRNLRELGHEAADVIANDLVLQERWAASRSLEPVAARRRPSLGRAIPYAGRLFRRPDRLSALLARRVEAERPDVLYFQDIGLCDPALIAAVRPFTKLVVGQIACPPPPEGYLRGCDLILTSFPHFVERFRRLGIASEYFRIGFDPSVLARLPERSADYGAVFVGGMIDVHAAGTSTLAEVAGEIGLDLWGYGSESLPAGSPLLARFHGEAWGIDMYRILRSARIVVNRHSSASEGYANNMRLFESTGVGSLVVTEEKHNLGELFEPGVEIVAYSDARDLVAKVRHYLEHEDERAAIAAAGQERTLREHTYLQRMGELEQILGSYL